MSCSGRTRAQRKPAAVARAGVRGRGSEIRAAVAAGREHDTVRAEQMHRAFAHVEREHAPADAFLVKDEIEREVLDEEARVVLERLLIERMQNRVAGAVRGCTRALRGALAIMRRHAAERALIDLAVFGARERHAVVLELDDRGNRLAAHVFDRVLIAEPVRTLDRVVEMEPPVVLAHVAERGRDAALRRDRMRARRKHFREARGLKPGRREAECRAQTRAAGADHDDVVLCSVIL